MQTYPSKLISLFSLTELKRVNLNGSAPHLGIPFANYSDFAFIDFNFSSSGKKEFRILDKIVLRSHPSIISIGSITFPFDLLIFSEFSSLTILWRITFSKGSLSVKSRENITILATQKNKISYPVSRTLLGNNVL